MNKDLLIRVRDHILAEPRRLNMSHWTQSAKPGDVVFSGYEVRIGSESKISKKDAPPCGTVACIAGWAGELSGNPVSDGGDGRRILRLTPAQAEELFYPDEWPGNAYSNYRNAKGPDERAAIVASVIDDFIARHE